MPYLRKPARRRPRPGHPLAPNRLAWLMQDGAEPTILRDTTGNGATATIGAASDWTTGPFGPCLSFTGAASSGLSFSIPVATTFWWAAWFRPAPQTASWCPLFTQGTSKGFYIRTQDSGSVQVVVYEAGGWVVSTVFPAHNEWCHLIYTARNGVLSCFVNGRDVTTPTLATTWTGMTADTMGRVGSSGEYYIGLIDSVYMSNGVAMTPSMAAAGYADHWAAFRPSRGSVAARVAAAAPAGTLAPQSTILNRRRRAG